ENTDGTVNFAPRMGMETLINGYKRILKSIYAPEPYYQRISTFLRHYNPTVQGRLQREDLQAFLRSMVRIGIFSRASFCYWRLLLKTLVTKRKALPAVVELAICGQHLFKVSDKVVSA
ncbi:MAG: DUF4070 domain-containing protein, partial [Desulfovibrionaceae bacterium]